MKKTIELLVTIDIGEDGSHEVSFLNKTEFDMDDDIRNFWLDITEGFMHAIEEGIKKK